MDKTSLPVPVSSPAKPQAAVSPLLAPSDFVDIDLNSPQPPSKVKGSSDVAGDLVLPPLKIDPSGHDEATVVKPSADAKVASDVELPKPVPERPSAPARRSHKLNPTNPAVAPSSLSTAISAAPPRPTTNPLRGEGQDQRNALQGMKSFACPPATATEMASNIVSRNADHDIRTANITEIVAKQAFLDFSRSKWCYSTAPAKEMTIQDLTHFRTYRYKLETFTEHRSCVWVTEPYAGQTSDTSVCRAVPKAWDVPVAVPQLFKDAVQKMVMPQTSSVQACSKCNGLGRNMCLKCHGTGRAQCMWCNGRGRRMQMEMCQHCYGSGTESCRMCQNINQSCDACSGKGRVLTFMQLTITWKNNVFEFITDHNSEFPTEHFKNVNGEKLFSDEQCKVPAITDFADPTVTRASQDALEQHRTQFTASCRILRQRQNIEWLALSKVQYRWKERQLSYFVYGKENKVFAQNYPKTCCCVIA